MTEKYDRETALRLAAETREDDERMTATPWQASIGELTIQADASHHDGPIDVATMGMESLNYDPFGIARTRNNLRVTADQLAAAVARIDALEVERSQHGNGYARMASYACIELEQVERRTVSRIVEWLRARGKWATADRIETGDWKAK